MEIEFDTNSSRATKEPYITVVACHPGKTAEIIQIPNTLKGMQDFIGGHIQAVYPSRDPIALVCHDEGKLIGLPLNRALYDEHGEIYDIIAGPMFICGLGEEDFASLSGDLLQKYQEKFKHPEQFVRFQNQIIAVKTHEPKKSETRTQKPRRHR